MSVWPAWEVQEDENATSWFHVRLAFTDGARVDLLAVVADGCASLEDVRHHGQQIGPGAVGERQPDMEPRGGALTLLHFPRGPHGHGTVRRTTIRKIKKRCF